VLIFAFAMFNIVGLRVVAGMLLIFFLPFYLVIRNLKIDDDEKIVFSFFLGLGLFGLLVMYLNKLIPSMRLTMAVVFVALCVLGIVLGFYRKRRDHRIAQH
jgi:uncharacterized membrane protein